MKKKKNNNWITLGILTSCKHKRELFIASRNSNNLDLINYYKNIAKYYLLSLRKQKKLNYADKIKNSLNNNKTIYLFI